MSNLAVSLSSETVERVLLNGDLSRLSSTEKLNYYSNVCQSLGLNALTQPFAYIKLNGKEVLYARAGLLVCFANSADSAQKLWLNFQISTATKPILVAFNA